MGTGAGKLAMYTNRLEHQIYLPVRWSKIVYTRIV
eukprot:SAG11_NODE_18317_length_494_cov_1.759494_1_plen_34_part_01